jgi:D-glycero-D-manno-heptose 1,7-bisphosphate phosphatase
LRADSGTGRKALFLDRDGVINRDKGYVYRWEDFEFLPGVVDAMRRFSSAGYDLIVTTNQSGIARGMFSESDFRALTARIEHVLGARGVTLTATYFCPHLANGAVERYAIRCNCRKPAPGMLLQAAADHRLDLRHSILVGDKVSDIEAAQRAGVSRSFLLTSNRDMLQQCPNCDGVVDSLSECADRLGLQQ